MKNSNVLFTTVLSFAMSIAVFHAPVSSMGADRGTYPPGHAEVIAAQQARRDIHYVELQDVMVRENLANDTDERPHQHWTVELANGNIVRGVYNTSGVPKLKLKVGDVISMGGEFIADDGGLMHWLHEDKRDRRPDGYVEIDGVRHGAANRSGIYTH